MNLITLDIETSCAHEVEPWMLPEPGHIGDPPGASSPPKTWKDPEKIADWHARRAVEVAEWRAEQEARQAQVPEDLRRRSSLDALLGGMVVCVGIAVDMQPATVLTVREVSEAEERRTLLRLDAGLAKYPQHRIVGYNLVGFDAPFLRARALRHGLYRLANRLWQPKPWDPRLVDLQVAWQAGDRRRPGRLVELAQMVGIEVTDRTTGADVQRLLDAGDLAAVAEHCRCDVEVTRQLALRFIAAGWLDGFDPDEVGELPVRPPRPSPAELARQLMIDMYRPDIERACKAAGIEWSGDIADPSTGPLITASVTGEQMRRFVLELQRCRNERGAA